MGLLNCVTVLSKTVVMAEKVRRIPIVLAAPNGQVALEDEEARTMVLKGGVHYFGDGLRISTRAMMGHIKTLKMHTDNIANFGVPGYQKKLPVATSFVEYLGPDGIDEVHSTEIGRLRRTKRSLDFALNTVGYLQRLNAAGGVELTRDGRMKLDKDGNLLSLDDKAILSSAGAPIRFPFVPENIDTQITVGTDGRMTVLNPKTQKTEFVGKIGIVTTHGVMAENIDLKQGFVEDSNVMLADEYVHMMPIRRHFEANRQLFIIQSDQLSRTIQELGRA